MTKREKLIERLEKILFIGDPIMRRKAAEKLAAKMEEIEEKRSSSK